MGWLYLAVAAVFEIVFALGMKLSHGFTHPAWTVATAVSVIGGVGFLTFALKTLPVSVAYPVWTAIGTLGVVAIGVAWLGETASIAKIASAVAIVAGVAGLKVASG